jgi:hypothetical protein
MTAVQNISFSNSLIDYFLPAVCIAVNISQKSEVRTSLPISLNLCIAVNISQKPEVRTLYPFH